MVKEEKIGYTLKVEKYHDIDKISNYSFLYKITKGDKETVFEISSRTSSCGSIQLMNLFVNKYNTMMDSGLNKAEREKVFKDIVEEYSDFNHFFFIDCSDGGLERFFGDLGFVKCWEYGNTNTYNIVNLWSYNVLSVEEVKALEEKEDEEEYGDEPYYEDEW